MIHVNKKATKYTLTLKGTETFYWDSPEEYPEVVVGIQRETEEFKLVFENKEQLGALIKYLEHAYNFGFLHRGEKK